MVYRFTVIYAERTMVMIFLSKSQIVFCFAAVLFAVCAGCIDVTYSGQRFPVYGIGGNAAVFRLGEKVPEDTYRTIGYIRLKANSGTPVLDFYEKLENEVFELGADAAAVDFFEPVLVSNPRLAQISAADYEPGGFGGDLKAPAGGGDGVVDRYVVVLEARVLVFEERYIEEMALRREGKNAREADPKNTGVNRVVLKLEDFDADESTEKPVIEPEE